MADENVPRVGDVAHLRSGSPKMTIIGVTDAEVQVAWVLFDTHVVHRDAFPIEAVRIIRTVEGNRT